MSADTDGTVHLVVTDVVLVVCDDKESADAQDFALTGANLDVSRIRVAAEKVDAVLLGLRERAPDVTIADVRAGVKP